MAAYISVPRDFSKVKSKVAFNLTARQLICFGAAAVVGVPLFFVLRDTAGNSGATLGMMAVMLPMFFLAMYQKNGQPAEKILRYYFQARFVRPKVRPYSKKFLDTHREEITLHKAAKAAFDETGLKKLPKVKALNAEYSDLLTQKKAAYPDYRKAREEMQELVKAQKNIELFFAEEKDAQEKQQTR